MPHFFVWGRYWFNPWYSTKSKYVAYNCEINRHHLTLFKRNQLTKWINEIEIMSYYLILLIYFCTNSVGISIVWCLVIVQWLCRMYIQCYGFQNLRPSIKFSALLQAKSYAVENFYQVLQPGNLWKTIKTRPLIQIDCPRVVPLIFCLISADVIRLS